MDMSDQSEETAPNYNYLLHAIWKDEHGKYAHRVIHTDAEGEWDPKACILAYIKEEHPSWLPNGVGQVGVAAGSLRMETVNVFKVTSWSKDDEWHELRDDLEAQRKVVDKKRSYEADMATIAALQRKWSTVEEQECEETTTGGQAPTTGQEPS